MAASRSPWGRAPRAEAVYSIAPGFAGRQIDEVAPSARSAAPDDKCAAVRPALDVGLNFHHAA
jgi:hypothetical protein